MTLFNAQVNAVGIEVQHPEDENHLIISIDLGMVLPLSDPSTNQPLIVPSGKISFPITKDAAESVSKRLSELADELSNSNIEVATDLGQVEKAAQDIERLRQGK